jgi:hypothetical protein
MLDSKLTQEEQERANILRSAIEGEITNSHAAKQLRLSVRQVQRAKAAIRKDGITSVVHGLKGKPGNHVIKQEIKVKALEIVKKTYRDFRPTFATEKLAEDHAIHISHETLRLWITEEGLWKPRKQRRVAYRAFRPRKGYYGELEQFDGSYHYWIENRYRDEFGDPIEVCLLAAIDDATGKITKAVFSANEGVRAVFTFWQEYIQENGKPLQIYLDKFSTYKINHKAAVDNTDLITQFQRATRTLGIELIFANSPQAKGRVERSFQTLQDRLVKEMRLAEVCTPPEGNTFLREVFLPKFNKQFAVVAGKTGNIHRHLTTEEKINIHHIFSLQDTRRVNNDFTVQFKNTWYQLTEIQPTTVRPKESVLIETWLDDSVHIVFKGYELGYFILPGKPQKQRTEQPLILTTHALNYKPPPNHPWRQYPQPKPALEGDDISILR